MRYLFIIIIYISLYSQVTYADTVISDTVIDKSTVWSKRNSPYIIQGKVNIFSTGHLSVDPGVVLIFENGRIFSKGKLALLGTPDKPIQIEIKQSGFTLFSGDKADISIQHVSVLGTSRKFLDAWNYSDIDMDNVTYNTDGLAYSSWATVYNNSTLDIDGLFLSNWPKTGIEVFNQASTTIRNSVFENIKTAVYSYNDSKLNISYSDFENNYIAVYADHGLAMNNWWGKGGGPDRFQWSSDMQTADRNGVVGGVVTSPWSAERNSKESSICCSNILFLPGLMGSRLYQKETLENQLWEPNRNLDVKKLFLNPDGESVEKNIYTRDIIGKTNIVGGLSVVEQTPYKDFIDFLNMLVKNKYIQSWKGAPYDWRFAPDTILEQGIRVGSQASVQRLGDIVLGLSKNSKTKKVTLITHSNGGLVAKQLMIDLKNKGLDTMIDKIIFVAMPEFGTPQAITSLLFGHEQSLAGGLILRASIAKKLGENMPTAYTLLPSNKFFTHISDPMYVGDIRVEGVMDLARVFQSRQDINQNLFDRANVLHNELDTWMPPRHVKIYQIVGTGLPTVSGLQKLDKDGFVPSYTKTGDGIVQDMFEPVRKVFNRTGIVRGIDLSKEKGKYKHVNIMNAPSVLKDIDQLLKKNSTTTGIEETGRVHGEAYYYEIAKISTPEREIDNVTLKYISPITKKVDSLNADSGNFTKTTEQSGENRYESFGNSLYYIADTVSNLEILGRYSQNVDVDIFKSGSTLRHISYDNIPIISGSPITISDKMIDLGAVNVFPSVVRDVSKDGSGITEVITPTSTKSIDEKIQEVRVVIRASNISPYLKNTYIRRLDVFAKNKNEVYLQGLISRLERGVVGIDRYRGNPILRSRYFKTRQDYVALRLLFTYLDPVRGASLRLE